MKAFLKTSGRSKQENTHPSPFAGSHFTEVDPWIKVHKSGPSLDKSTKIVRQIEEVFELNHTMFKERRGEKKK